MCAFRKWCNVSGFSREALPNREKMVNVRVTGEEKLTLRALAPLLGARGQSEVVRLALDYYLEHSPDARSALRRLKRE